MRISDLALLCRLQGHKADPAAEVWNRSICFGRCKRCGSDLVRRAKGKWQVPRGYRVVWRAPAKEIQQPAPVAQTEWEAPLEAASFPEEPIPAELEIIPEAEEIQDEAGNDAAPLPEWPLQIEAAEQQTDFPIDAPAVDQPNPQPNAAEPPEETVTARAAAEPPQETVGAQAAAEPPEEAVNVDAAAGPREETIRAHAADFMDDPEDDFAWSDLADARRTSALI